MPGRDALGRVPPGGRPGAERQPLALREPEVGTGQPGVVAPAKGEGLASLVVDPHGSGRGARQLERLPPCKERPAPGES